MAHPATKRRRCVLAVKKRLRKYGPMKSFRQVADIEGVSARTVEDWFYRAQKVERQEAQEESLPRYGQMPDSQSAGRGDVPTLLEPPPPPSPQKPFLVADCGQYRCSRCGSAKHLIRRGESTFFCEVCSIRYEFDPGEDYEVMSPKPSGGPYSWMG